MGGFGGLCAPPPKPPSSCVVYLIQVYRSGETFRCLLITVLLFNNNYKVIMRVRTTEVIDEVELEIQEGREPCDSLLLNTSCDVCRGTIRHGHTRCERIPPGPIILWLPARTGDDWEISERSWRVPLGVDHTGDVKKFWIQIGKSKNCKNMWSRIKMLCKLFLYKIL